TLNIHGSLLYQGPQVTNSSGTTITKSVIRTPFNNAALISRFGKAVAFSFTSAAKLVLVSDLDGNNVEIQVRYGVNRVDVSSYLDIQFNGDTVVEASSKRLDTGAESDTRYQLMSLKLHNDGDFASLGIHFSVNGLATTKSKTFFLDGVPHLVDRPAANLLSGD